MRAVFGGSVAGTTRIDGQISQDNRSGEEQQQHQQKSRTNSSAAVRRINGQRISFGDLARFAWPEKTDANISYLLGVDARTCRRWLRGDNEPPAEALGAVLCEIMRRFHQRE